MGIPIVLSVFHSQILMVSLGFPIGAGISVIFAITFVINSKLSNEELENGMIKKFFNYITPVFLGSLFTSLMGTVDRIILPALTNLTLSAVYTYSLTIATIVTAITAPFSFILFPKISQHFGSSNPVELKQYSQGSTELFYFVGLPASIGAAILSRQLLSVLVGGIYAEHYIILQIMVFSNSFFSFRPIITSIILAVRRTRVYLYSGAAALVVNLLISIILIPGFGLFGAVAASISAWGISTIPRMISLGSLTKHEFNLMPFMRMWVNAGLMALAVIFTTGFFQTGLTSLFVPTFLGIILYIGFSLLNRPFSHDSHKLVELVLTNNNKISGFFVRIIMGKEFVRPD